MLGSAGLPTWAELAEAAGAALVETWVELVETEGLTGAAGLPEATGAVTGLAAVGAEAADPEACGEPAEPAN